MRKGVIFGQSFLDGFTMAGFLQRLPRPGETVRLMEPPVNQATLTPWVFEMGAGTNAQLALSGDLHRVPEPTLRKMMALLEEESEYRKTHGAPA